MSSYLATLFLFVVAAYNVYAAIVVERDWNDGLWAKVRRYMVMLNVASALWCIFAAGTAATL